jgi:hypothetical protein
MVLRHLRARVELDDREGDVLPFDCPRMHVVPDAQDAGVANVIECH